MKKSKVLATVVSVIRKISPAYFRLLVFNALAVSGQILTNTVLPKFLIDELLGSRRPDMLVMWVAVIAGSNFLLMFLKNTAKRLCDVNERVVLQKTERAFAEKIMSVEYRHLEDPYYLDLKERAAFAMLNQSAVSNLVRNSLDFFGNLLTVISLIAVMLTLSWILVLSLLLMIALVLLIQSGFAKYQQKFFNDLIPINRRYGYYINLTFQKEIHKDARISGMTDMLCSKITSYNLLINKWFGKYHRKQGLYMGLFRIVVVLQTAFAYAFVGASTIGIGGIGIGDLTMYVSAAIGFSSAVIALGTNLVTIEQMLNYLVPFAELMIIPDEEQNIGDRTLGTVESVVFENVTFRYPKSENTVLDNVSFDIHRGEKVSIVGLNGAGKSTVIKLLCRLYKPDSGRILINGTDINEYNHSSFLSEIAAVFQDFRLFNFSVEENITCKPIGADDEKVKNLIADVGLTEKIASLPNGTKSLFGKDYDEDGIEFSGGQAQKVAIARALYKDASLVVLDEPTSALDPIAEAEIYANFNLMTGNKTAIYISHRMSSSVFCDRILVLNNGRIEAFGTHHELMQDTDGLYCKLFSSQSENYRK